MSNTFDKLSVLDSFIEEVNSYLPEIENNLAQLAQSPSGSTSGDMDAIEETYRRTHTIGGSASMMDFPGLAHVAHGMEDILGDVLDGVSTLDSPTIGLLQRSLGRMHQLLQGIHEGIDEEAIMAEDDADYVHYRALTESSAQQIPAVNGSSNIQQPPQSAASSFAAMPEPFPAASTASSMPSLDEVLASFRTSPVTADEDVAWPEDSAPAASFDSTAPVASVHETQTENVSKPLQEEQVIGNANLETNLPAEHESASPSALDMLVASTFSRPANSLNDPAFISAPHHAPEASEASEERPDTHLADVTDPRQPSLVAQTAPSLQSGDPEFPAVFNDLQEDAQTLAVQASSLKELVNQLREAMSVIESQRTEFKGFLDGSKDALDRMEDWAGQAMGLNLRNSPEQVRRYLPLSVMWVSNTKLKKVLDLLTQITSGVGITEEQIRTALQQLSASIESCGAAFWQATNPSRNFTYDQGWTPWEMHVLHEAQAMRESVTFERRGDPAALRAEIESMVREEYRRDQEAKLRDEIRNEYETRPLTLAARTELERQLREEIRQDFEANRQLQERVSGPENSETLQELESRLRSEIEIEVRQEFLNQISAGSGAILNQSIQQTLMPPVPTAPRISNFVDQARQATGLPGLDIPASVFEVSQNDFTAPPPKGSTSSTVSQQSPTTPQWLPQPVAQQPLSSATAFSGDFGEEATEIFRLEAEEHLQTIIMHVAALEKAPTNRELIQGIRRATHTLKGAASMMGFRAIADLSHIFEDLLESAMEGTTTITPTVLSLVLDTAETLDLLITGRGTDSQEEDAKVQLLRVRYAELLGEQRALGAANADDIDTDELNEEGLMLDTASVAGIVPDTQTTETNAQRAARGDLSVRVRLQKLDELVNLFGELLVNRSILEERVNRLVQLVSDVGVSNNRLRDVGQKLESRFEATTLPSGHSVQVMPGEGLQSKGFPLSSNGNKNRLEPEHLADFDELELDRYTEFHQLARGLSEGISDMTTLSTEMEAVIRDCEGVFARENRLNTTFQDRLMKARLVPLSTMTPRLYRAARAVALKQHKEFEFLLEGENTEVDRTVNEEIAGPLLHLMRNAVNHAIETPEERVKMGKSPAGQIKLSAAYEGNQVVITVRDDGVGIDPERVRVAAIERGFIRADQILNDSDIIDLIFRPGFSTAEVLSEEGGRGVGLDVVRDSVSRLRGTLEVESMPGQGTAFTMKFPTSLAIQSAMMVMAGGQQFAIPTVLVEAIGRLDNFKRATLAGRPAVIVQKDLYPLYTLAQLLSLPSGPQDERAPLLLINAGGHRVALIVDDIKGKLDVVMKNLGPHLRSIHGVAGGTVMGNGRVVLILELIELLSTRKLVGSAAGTTSTSLQREGMVVKSLQTGSRSSSYVQKPAAVAQPPASSDTAEAEHGKHILVVDDSPSVRRVVSNMLKQHGWEVQMARDGVEALEMISQQTPAAVLLDIEMPRMDGYELISTVRAQDQYRTLPLVVLTSRAAAKHQQRAIQLGASSYVVKPYQDEELINILNTLVYGAAAR
ncbi:MAG TPA: response regulator [Ktedonobacteraceae bacterium]|nr:response regulator [Ktedonobacteraceae bacterium]